jgi:hypothetical protein
MRCVEGKGEDEHVRSIDGAFAWLQRTKKTWYGRARLRSCLCHVLVIVEACGSQLFERPVQRYLIKHDASLRFVL